MPRHGVVCDSFDLIASIEGGDLVLTLDTDLPSDAVVRVRVDREYTLDPVAIDSFHEQGETNSQSYFAENNHVSFWRDQQRIPLDDQMWKEALAEKQDEQAILGKRGAFRIVAVSESVTVTADLNTYDRVQGEWISLYPDLTGSAVEEGWGEAKIIRSETHIHYPLDGELLQVESNYVHHDDLEESIAYRLSNQTPLAPLPGVDATRMSEDQMLNALVQIRYLPAGTVVDVVAIRRDKSGRPAWYGVVVRAEEPAEGWIKPIALMNQRIAAVTGR